MNIIVLSDWLSNEDLAPIPMLLATAAVHHHLIREKTRTQVGLIVETGEAREVHHFALLLGYGAAAINPYLAFDTIERMVELRGARRSPTSTTPSPTTSRPSGKGILKVMSKMGISTVASYTGAQIFEAIGLGRELVDEYFTGTVSRLGGIGLDEVAEEVRLRHARAYPLRPEEQAHRDLDYGGEYQWRREGEYHLFNPKTVFKLQHAHAQRPVRGVQGVHASSSTTSPTRLRDAARACSASARPSPARSRSTRSSRRARSSSASRPGP